MLLTGSRQQRPRFRSCGPVGCALLCAAMVNAGAAAGSVAGCAVGRWRRGSRLHRNRWVRRQRGAPCRGRPYGPGGLPLAPPASNSRLGSRRGLYCPAVDAAFCLRGRGSRLDSQFPGLKSETRGTQGCVGRAGNCASATNCRGAGFIDVARGVLEHDCFLGRRLHLDGRLQSGQAAHGIAAAGGIFGRAVAHPDLRDHVVSGHFSSLRQQPRLAGAQHAGTHRHNGPGRWSRCAGIPGGEWDRRTRRSSCSPRPARRRRRASPAAPSACRFSPNTPAADPAAAARGSTSILARTSRSGSRGACAQCALRCRGPAPALCRAPWW